MADRGTATLPDLPSDSFLGSYVRKVALSERAWTDTTLVVAGLLPVKLHALFAVRSPVLCEQLQGFAASGPPYTLTLKSTDVALTQEALEAAVATLYGAPLDLALFAKSVENARALLAAATVLGLKDLAKSAYNALVAQISPDTLLTLLQMALEHMTDGGPLADVFPRLESFIVENLDPLSISSQGPFADAVAMLPFEQFASLVASNRLKIASDMQRHTFAREAVAFRARADPSRPEETVVLAFGGGSNGVRIIQK